MIEPDLFRQPQREDPARENNPEKVNLRLEAADWIENNPRARGLLLGWARELAAKKRNFGVALLVERLRWEAVSEGWTAEQGDFKVNNNHRAYIARWLIQEDPTLEGFLRFREVQW